VVEQVLADVARVDDHVDTVLSQLASRTDTAEHQQLRALKDALGEDDFTSGVEVALSPGAIDDSHTRALAVGVTDE
jgi:hypothetical protein